MEELKLDFYDSMNELYGQLSAKLFCKLKVLELCCKHDKSTVFPSVFVRGLHNLKKLYIEGAFFKEICGVTGILEHLSELKLSNMPKLMHLSEDTSQPSSVFQNLQILKVSECGKLKSLVPSSIIFRNLKTIKVSKCHGLICLLVPSIARCLVQLKEMVVSECKRMTQIIASTEAEARDDISFSQLKSLELHQLPSLTSFYLGKCTIKFPLLKEVIVTECPELESFSNGVSSTPMLHGVKLAEKYERNQSDELVTQTQKLCNNDFNTTIQQFWEDNFDTCVERLFTEDEEVCFLAFM